MTIPPTERASAPRNPLDDEPEETWREALATWVPPILAIIFIRLFLFEPFRIPSGSMVPTLLIGDHVMVTKFSYGVWLPLKSIGVPFTSWGLDDLGLPVENIELIDGADPQRGDIIVFHYPLDEDLTYIKRVVGLPGDEISVLDNRLTINGVEMPRASLGPYGDVTAIAGRCDRRPTTRHRSGIVRTDGSTLPYATLTNARGAGPLANRPRRIVVPPESVFVMGDNRDHSQDSREWRFVRYDQIKGKAQGIWFSHDGCAGGAFGALRFGRMFQSLYREPPDDDPGAP